ncbi:MAG: putative lipid II flippase FtsW [Clostridiales bacterium]|nr:putative lipid II flippase FtsW [Clostridiales bacterium]
MAPRTGYAGGLRARYTLLFATFFLLCGGVLMVYSASSASDVVRLQDGAHHLKRHLAAIALGFTFMAAAMAVDYRRMRWSGPALWIISLTGLVIVLVNGVGKWGATRWIDLGPFTIQPSELAKIGCVLVAAILVQQYRQKTLTASQFWLRIVTIAGAPSALIMFQPDLGTAISICAAVYFVLLISGASGKVLSGVAVGGLVAIAGLIAIAPYRLARFTAFLDPWADPQGAGYQSIQAMYAFGSGGITGVGLGMSRQKFFYLPAAHTDFIFAIIGEELGLAGTLSVVLAFAAIAYAGVRIALGCKDQYGRLIAGGLTGMIVLQAVMNMAAVTGLMPVKGITLPLVSFGGSSLVLTMLCIGLIMSVSTYGARAEARVNHTSKEKSTRANRAERRGNRRSHLSGIDGGRAVACRRT